MFGYVTINRDELKMKEYDLYRSYYCGLCHILKDEHGRTGQLLLNYDMTFLAMLLDALYEETDKIEKHRCIAHPASVHMEVTAAATEYAADMTILLAYQKAQDDWNDEYSVPKRTLALKLYGDYRKLRKKYPRQAKALEECVKELSLLEKEGCSDIDQVAGLTGRFLGEIFNRDDDFWKSDLYELGFYLGKLIYLLDAYDDLEKDEKKGSYNLFLQMRETDPEQFDKNAEEIMVAMAAGAARAFERLPILRNAEILRNILYSGVWVKYAAARKKRSDGKINGKEDEKSI